VGGELRQDFVTRKLNIFATYVFQNSGLSSGQSIQTHLPHRVALEVVVRQLNGSFDMPWMESESWVTAVNQFWFEDLRPIDWFGGGARIDAEIRTRFGALRDDLKNNPPEGEHLESDGLVAAVIVFDQFPRNLFRKSPEAYATDSLALTLACQAVDHGLDAPLGLHQRQFLYMPFMHSENREMQERSVALFRQLGAPDLLGYAEHHSQVIERFGRFPHRNDVLGRESTIDELEFLSSEPEYF
jgi:uncharacterized protein (DUF924 family)